MATGWSVMDALNKNTKAAGAADDTAKARFRTRDISIKKIYPNDMNFYSMSGIEKLAQDILAAGLMENLVVAYAPCEKGEYRIISGEKRWRALTLLVQQGFEEFEMVTCQVKSPAEEHEERVQLIVANSYRDKTIVDILEEEKQLKASLQYMKDNGLTLAGYKLDSGRLRDVIADMMNMTSTKIAQIESINKRLIPEFTEELKEGRLTFSAAYEISGMDAEAQQAMLEKYKETGSLTFKDVKEAKQAAAEEAAAAQLEGQMEYPKDYEGNEEPEDTEEDEQAEDSEEEEYQTPHPEGITSLCYGCQRYSECNVKTSTCTSCDQYINKAEAEKTDEQKYSEEQDAIDRETAKKLREMEQEEKMQNLPSDDKKMKCVRMSASEFERVAAGLKPYMILKNDGYSEGDDIKVLEFKEGRATGQQMQLHIICMDTDETSSALEEGYCIIGIQRAQEQLKEAGEEAAEGAAQDAAAPTLNYGA